MSRQATLTCPLDCPDACRLKVTLDTREDPRDGRRRELLVSVAGDPDHPVTRGFACVKTYRYPDRINHPDRPLTPLRRVNPKTDPEPVFVPAGWDEALDAIAGHWRGLIDEHGPTSLLRYNYAGTMGLREGDHVHTLFRALGARELDETICSSAGGAAWRLGYGPTQAVPHEDVQRARAIVLWGINSLSTHSHLTPDLTAARRAGARIVCVDPYRNRTAAYADEHLRIVPGTDAVLALAVIRELFTRGWADEEYLREATVGAADLRDAAEPWTVAEAAAVTGLEPARIEELAALIGQTRPTYLRVGYGMTRHENGGTALRAVSLIPAVTGDWRYRGGGCTVSSSGAFALNKARVGGAHLVRPGTPVVNMNQIGDALHPDAGVRALTVYNSNPAVVAPDSGKVRAGLTRPDLFVVVLEQAMTETARLADWVLPSTTFVEHGDFYTSYGHHWLSCDPPTVEPPGLCRPNSWVFAELGRRLGVAEPSLYWTLDELVDEVLDTDHPFLAGITRQRLQAEGSVRLNIPDGWLPYADGAPTPSGKVQLVPAPRFEPVTAGLDAGYPLRLVTPPAHHFLNSTYGNVARLAGKEGGEPVLLLDPVDAAAAGVVDGAPARIESEHGAITRRVRVGDDARPGVAVLEGTWWGLSAPDGTSVNELTAQTLTDLGGGSTFHNTRVRVSPLPGDGPAPRRGAAGVTAGRN